MDTEKLELNRCDVAPKVVWGTATLHSSGTIKELSDSMAEKHISGSVNAFVEDWARIMQSAPLDIASYKVDVLLIELTKIRKPRRLMKRPKLRAKRKSKPRANLYYKKHTLITDVTPMSPQVTGLEAGERHVEITTPFSFA